MKFYGLARCGYATRRDHSALLAEVTGSKFPVAARLASDRATAILGRNIGVTVIIYEWSIPEDRQILLETFQKGQNDAGAFYPCATYGMGGRSKPEPVILPWFVSR